MEKPEIAQYSTLDFHNWNETGTLELTPKFQRREVWKTPARSYFIDSLLRGIPIPPIFLRVTLNPQRTKTVREVIDGQQRLRAVLDFKSDKYALSKGHETFGGKRFSSLPQASQDVINSYGFVCSVFKNITDAEILDVFARLNTYAVALNPQELRNGRYFGQFKQCAHSIAFEHIQFWREYGIFAEASIARMLEVELTSELLIAEIAGQQDKKSSVDRFYAEKDETFPERTIVETRFRSVVDHLTEATGSVLKESEFSRPPLFYTLFCVVFHYMYGLPNQNQSTPRRHRVARETADALRDGINRLSDIIGNSKQGVTGRAGDADFIIACSRQTDNIQPRQIRFDRLYREAFGNK